MQEVPGPIPGIPLFYSLFRQRQAREYERQQREERVERRVCARGVDTELIDLFLQEFNLLLHLQQFLGQGQGCLAIFGGLSSWRNLFGSA